MSYPRKSSHVRAVAVWTLSLIFGACEAIAASSSLNLAADEVLNLNESFFVTQADVGEVNEQGDQSGAAITDGDFNGDGFVDLAVGSPGEGPDAGSGAVSIFLGSEAGVTTGSFITQAAAGEANEEGDRFGAALFAGDFNGDGFEDLVVAAPGKAPDTDPRSGAVFIFPGSEEGITAGFMITQTAAGEVNEKGDRFGAAVTVGSFNDDGFEDLVVGAPGEAPGTDPRSGAVFIFPGSEEGITAGFMITQTAAGEVNEKGDRFGAVLVTGDFDGDRSQELVVGAPGEAPGTDPKSGAVFVFRGSATGLLTTLGFLITQTDAGEVNEEGDQFGAALGAGDIDSDNDSLEELVIGAPGKRRVQTGGQGLSLYSGGSATTGLLTTPGFMITQADAGGVNEEGDQFGAAVVLGVFSGDNFEELAVGAPGDAPDGGPRSGAVYVFPGSESGITPGFMITQADAGGVNEEGDQFGAALSAEDFNDTNAAELAVGAAFDAPGAGPRSGAVFIFPGVNPSPPSINQENAGAVNEDGDEFGRSSVTGDFNGDGFKDLAIGAPGEDRNSGVVFLFPGSEVGTGITTGYFITQADAGGMNKRGRKFGAALAAGDFNGDGFDDLVVGAPGGNPQSPAVFMFSGSAEGVTTGYFITQADAGGMNKRGRKFGAALAAGDFNGDGFDDLVVGAPGHGSRVAGGVFVFPGSPIWISTGFFIRTPGRARFGAALAGADFNDDGFEDLAVGAPGKGRESGAVFLFPGSQAGISGDGFITRNGAGKMNKFGAALAAGDFNGDSFDDLAVGAPRAAPGADPRSGAVFLFPGSAAGISADFLIITQTDADEVNERGGRFGAALAAGDFNGDGIGDLVVGAPEKGDPRSGAIFIFPGSEEGISVGYFTAQAGNGGANEAGDRFGTALAFGDFDGNNLDDLAVGTPGEAPGLDPKSGAVYIIDEEEILEITGA